MPFRPHLAGARPARETALPVSLRGVIEQVIEHVAPPEAPVADAAPIPFPTLADAMRDHIGAALKRTAGQIEGPGGAAALLGLNPHTLRGKMRKLKIDWASFRA